MATIVMLLPFICGYAQETNELFTNGNIFYKKHQYIKAIETYQQIIKQQPANYAALHNAGNALYKNNQYDKANEMYTKAIESTNTPSQKAAAWFNKGVVLQNSNQLSPAIDAYKNALKINPTDDDARKNLQKALTDLIKQKQKQAEGKQPKKQQPKPKEQPNKPNPTPNKMTKKEAEEKLKALSEKEKNLQDKLHKKEAGSTANPDKDW